LFTSQVMGVTISVVSGGVLTMIAVAYVAARAEIIRNYETPPAVHPA
jgi:hypothetical protein